MIPADWPAILARIQARVANPLTCTDMRRGLPDPPLDLATVPALEARLGFALPPLLVDLYRKVGNGGFGPGYGLLSLRLTEKRAFGVNVFAVLNFLSGDGAQDDDPAPDWPLGFIPLVYWGCTAYSVLDCTAEDLLVYGWDCDCPDAESDWPIQKQFRPTEIGLAAWLDHWATGETALTP
jgi:hypothetical protein